MNLQLLEIRDRGTCIVGLVIRFQKPTNREVEMLSRCGYETLEDFVLLANLDNYPHIELTYDPFQQSSNTMKEAHKFLREHPEWLDDPKHKVLDVRVLTGELENPARSEFCE